VRRQASRKKRAHLIIIEEREGVRVRERERV